MGDGGTTGGSGGKATGGSSSSSGSTPEFFESYSSDVSYSLTTRGAEGTETESLGHYEPVLVDSSGGSLTDVIARSEGLSTVVPEIIGSFDFLPIYSNDGDGNQVRDFLMLQMQLNVTFLVTSF